MELKVKALSPLLGTKIDFPAYATAGAAGMDLRACIEEPVTIPGQGSAGADVRPWAAIPTGLAVAIPEGYAGLVFARSGLAVKHGLAPVNAVGVIDSDYRGEVKVGLINQGWEDYTVQPGERMAQLVLVPAPQARVVAAETLPDTDRGAGGFGSTGSV